MEAVFALPDDETLIDAAENELCKVVYGTLRQAYPGYPWGVGVSRQGGVVVIKLPVPLAMRSQDMGEPGFLLYISTVIGPGGPHRVLMAAGEVLERWQLIRAVARGDWVEQAWENGLDKSNMILKSKA